MKKSLSLTDDPIWTTAAEVAQYAYSLLDQLPDEEKWGISSTLRRQAFTLTTNVAEAIGSNDPRDRMHYFGLAQKEAFGLKNTLTMAKRMDYFAVEPEKMVSLDEIVASIDTQFENARENIPTYMLQFESRMKSEKK
jgi:four helix bundle protein